jgi:DNA-binding transcriptional LysR family regulator
MIDRRLRVLRMVATCGTVTGAAEALHYTPSAVSQQIRTLATDLGVDLVVQDGRRIRLTSAARVLLDQTEDLYARWEEIRGLVAAADAEGGGVVRLCGFSTAAAALLPPVASRLQAAQPAWQVRLIEAEPQQCFELVLADEADVAVVVATAELPASNDPRFELTHLLVDPLDLLLPETHDLAHEPHVRLADLADEPWIMDRPGRVYHQLLQTACAAAGFTPSVAHHASEWDTGAAMVAAGLGIALIPRLAHLPTGYAVVRVPLAGDPASARRIVTGIRRGSRDHPAVATALRALAEIAHDLADTRLAPHVHGS